MPPRSKIQARCKKASEARWNPPAINVDAMRLAFAILIEGVQPEKTLRTLEWCNIRCRNREKMYHAMVQIGEEIIRLAEYSMEYERQNLPDGCTIAFDGSWSHRRRGTNCLFSVICRQTGRVIESVVVSNKIQKTSPNFCAHSNLMEAHGLKLAVQRLKEIPQIAAYVHDNDGNARKIIEESGWQIKEFLDPGHALKCFEKRLKKFNGEHPRILKGIQKSLTKWLRALMRYDAVKERKVDLWLNSYRHYMGDHRLCLHEDRPFAVWDKAADPGAVELFKTFLQSTKFIIEYCDTEFDTQSNESLHKLKLKYATKDVKWSNSWRARMMCAVLDRNMRNWKLYLYDKLGLPALSPETRKSLEQREKRRIEFKLYFHSENYRLWKHNQRKQQRQREKRISQADQRLWYGIRPNFH